MRVEVKSLTKMFDAKCAVNDLSFSFESGDVVGFVGPNGAGKTTTMSIMATLDLPTSGDVTIDGISAVDYPEKVRSKIGMMPDSLPAQKDITAHEYIDFFARAYGLRGSSLKKAVDEVEEFTNITELRDKTLFALSKGMKQRVSLARALVHNPDLVIMDEPANGLDPRARVELRELTKAIGESGKAVLVSSHILSELAEMSTKFVIIEQGKLISSGSMEEISKQNGESKRKVLIRAMEIACADLIKTILEFPFVESAVENGEYIMVTFCGSEAEATQLLTGLVAKSVKLLEFKNIQNSLEEVFMHVTQGKLA